MFYENNCFSLWLGHQNRRNVHSPEFSFHVSLTNFRDIQSFAISLFEDMNIDDVAQRLWKNAVATTTKAEIHKIYIMVLSVAI